jgi:hypothetical protein
MGNRKWMAAAIGILILSLTAGAQEQTSQQQNNSFYQVTLVGKTITSVSYQHRSGSTMIDFRGTPLLPMSKGDAKVDSKQGSIIVSTNFKNLQSAQMFGKEYLTYVLWAITPEGKPYNLGELVLDGAKSQLTATTTLQSFGMIVTAEPYFAVSVPSDVVVLENVLRADTVGTSEQVNANYELLKRGQYTYDMARAKEPITSISPKIPLQLYEARNAVAIAQSAGADTLAPDAYQKALASLNNADSLMARKANKKDVIAASRDAVQAAADARQIAVQRAAQDKLAAEKAAQQAATADARAKQQQEEAARQQAELQKLQAERDAAREAAARAQADWQRNNRHKARSSRRRPLVMPQRERKPTSRLCARRCSINSTEFCRQPTRLAACRSTWRMYCSRSENLICRRRLAKRWRNFRESFWRIRVCIWRWRDTRTAWAAKHLIRRFPSSARIRFERI